MCLSTYTSKKAQNAPMWRDAMYTKSATLREGGQSGEQHMCDIDLESFPEAIT